MFVKVKLDNSEELQKKALEGREKVWGIDHPHTLLAVHRLASVYIDKGMFDVARPLCIRALEGREKALGSDHMDTIESVKLLEELEKKRG